MKNCPFCGGTSGMLLAHPNGTTSMFCKTCNADGPRKQTSIDAVNAWDYRFDAGEIPRQSPAREARSGRALYEEIQRKAEAQAMDLYIKTVLAEALNKFANELHQEVVAYVNVIKTEIKEEFEEKK